MGVTTELLHDNDECTPHTIEHRGKVYPLRLVDQEVQGEFEKALYKKDREKAKTLRELDIITAEEYEADEARMKEAFRNGEYEMLSEVGLKRLATMDGIKILLSLIVPCSQAELFALMHAKRDELLSKLQLVIKESFPGVEFTLQPPGEASPNR